MNHPLLPRYLRLTERMAELRGTLKDTEARIADILNGDVWVDPVAVDTRLIFLMDQRGACQRDLADTEEVRAITYELMQRQNAA